MDEVVLHGFEHGSRHAIGEAIELEIGRLLAKPHSPALKSSPQMDAGAFHTAGDAKPQSVGVQTARGTGCPAL
jgi:hypothetical protein